MKYIGFLSILGLLTITSCKNDDKLALEGFYQLKQDSCQSINFKVEQKVEYKKSCRESKLSGVSMKRMSGEIVELFCGGDLDYVIDKIDKNKGIYLRTIDKNNEVCKGFYILSGEEYIILTELKQGEGIDFHFTEPKIYLTQGSKDLEVDSEKLIVELPSEKEEGIYYIAFNQADGNEAKFDEKRNTYLEYGLSDQLKTRLEINPKHYAFQTYEFAQVNETSRDILPVIYHREYQSIREMSVIQQENFMKERRISKGGKYILLYRFNPGRKRNVNKVFGEEIEGQVQSFEVMKY